MHRAPTCDVPRLATDEGDVSGVQHATCAAYVMQQVTRNGQRTPCNMQRAAHNWRCTACDWRPGWCTGHEPGSRKHVATRCNVLQHCRAAALPAPALADPHAVQRAILRCNMLYGSAAWCTDWVARHLNVQRQLYPRRPRPTLTHSVHRRIQDMRHTMRVSAAPQRVRRYHNLRRTLSPTQSFAHETAHVAGSGAARCHT